MCASRCWLIMSSPAFETIARGDVETKTESTDMRLARLGEDQCPKIASESSPNGLIWLCFSGICFASVIARDHRSLQLSTFVVRSSSHCSHQRSHPCQHPCRARMYRPLRPSSARRCPKTVRPSCLGRGDFRLETRCRTSRRYDRSLRKHD